MDTAVTLGLPVQVPRLWDYVCSITYPRERVSATNHALFMLNNARSRVYFISRLLIQYIVQQMWDPKAWEGMDESVTETLVLVKRGLESSGYGALQPWHPLPPPSSCLSGCS